MLRRGSRMLRFGIVLIAALVLSAVFVSSAQTGSTPPTQFLETNDGLISVRLPDGWLTQEEDNPSPIFGTALAFGNNATSLQAAINSITSTQTTPIPGEYGAIAALSSQYTAALDPTTGTSTLYNNLISGLKARGGQVLQEQQLTDAYPGTIALVDDPKLEQEGILGVFKAGPNFIVFTINASPEADFETNNQMFLDIINTIHVPGEQANTVEPTAAAATTEPVNPQPVPGDQPVVTSPTGIFSVHLPDGWANAPVTIDNFTDSVSFGDTQDAMQAAAGIIVKGDLSTKATGVGGVIGAINIGTQAPAGLVDPIIQRLLSAFQADGFTVTQQPQPHTFGGKYAGELAQLNVGYVGVLPSNDQLVVVMLLSDDAAANNAAMTDLMESISIPAEAAIQLPAVTPEPQPTTAAPSGETGVIMPSKTGAFSTRLPEGWLSHASTVLQPYSDAIYFGSDEQAQQTGFDMTIGGLKVGKFDGVAGFIGKLDVGGVPDQAVTDVMAKAAGIVTRHGIQLDGQPQAHTFGGQYPGQLEKLDIGYLAVMASDNTLLVAILLSDDMDSNDATMNAVLESIRIPAESASAQQTTTAEATEAAPSETATVRSSDNRISLDLSSNWFFIDHVADGDILAYGDSSDAAMSRLYSVKPDLATKTVITGNGGVVVLYPMSRFGIDPNNPDLMPLMTHALGNLKGYTVEQAAQPVPGLNGAVYAIISGAEDGFLVLIPSGDQIIYATGTGATEDSFNALQDTFKSIIGSIHSPAVAVATEEASGLGGLEATPEITPEATSSGLNGL